MPVLSASMFLVAVSLVLDSVTPEIGRMKSGNLPAGSAEAVPENAIEANITKAKCFGNVLLRMRFLRKKPCKSVFPSRLRNSMAGRRTRRARHTWLPAALRRGLTPMSVIACRDQRYLALWLSADPIGLWLYPELGQPSEHQTDGLLRRL